MEFNKEQKDIAHRIIDLTFQRLNIPRNPHDANTQQAAKGLMMSHLLRTLMEDIQVGHVLKMKAGEVIEIHQALCETIQLIAKETGINLFE